MEGQGSRRHIRLQHAPLCRTDVGDSVVSLLRRRSHRFIGKNLLGMDLRTTERRWAKHLHHFSFGLNEATFTLLALFYTEALTQLGIPLGVLHVEHSEDESAIQDQPRFVLYHGAVPVVRPRDTLTRVSVGRVRWNQRRDILTSF